MKQETSVTKQQVGNSECAQFNILLNKRRGKSAKPSAHHLFFSLEVINLFALVVQLLLVLFNQFQLLQDLSDAAGLHVHEAGAFPHITTLPIGTVLQQGDPHDHPQFSPLIAAILYHGIHLPLVVVTGLTKQ